MAQRAIAGVIKAQQEAEERETIVVLDEKEGVGFRVRADHHEISDNLPITSRWIPDFRLIRKNGALTGAALGMSILLFGLIVGFQKSAELGIAIGFAGIMLSGPLMIFGWFYAPKYLLHDYKAFTVVRRITLHKNDEPPLSAWDKTHAVGDQIVYIVPYAHTFLNLANRAQEDMGDDYESYVARATIMFEDSKQKSMTLVQAGTPDAWSRMKQHAMLGFIAVELLFLFLMMNVMMG